MRARPPAPHQLQQGPELVADGPLLHRLVGAVDAVVEVAQPHQHVCPPHALALALACSFLAARQRRHRRRCRRRLQGAAARAAAVGNGAGVAVVICERGGEENVLLISGKHELSIQTFLTTPDVLRCVSCTMNTNHHHHFRRTITIRCCCACQDIGW